MRNMPTTLPESLTARPATMDDVEAAVELANACSVELIGRPEWDVHRFRTDWESDALNPQTDLWLVFAPGGRLVPVTHEQGRVTEIVPPVSVGEPRPGVFVYALGRNMTGWVRLKIAGGREGETVGLRYAEAVHPDGALNPASNNAARQEDRYTMKGAAEETYEPRFTYHGFRYVELTGHPGKPGLYHDLVPRWGRQGEEPGFCRRP